MSTLLKALAAAVDGLVVPVREKGSISVENIYGGIDDDEYINVDVDETWFLISEKSNLVLRNIYNSLTYRIDMRININGLLKCDLFGKPLAIDFPKASALHDKTFVEFANIATHNQISALYVGFLTDGLLYVLHNNLVIYNLETEEEKIINDEMIPVSLLSKTGSVVFINAGKIINYSDLDFNMLKEFGMC
ncbi:MAG: hypothetical protein SPF22_07370 [Candidatus Onthovivens sp.]|nr:hypothetical protein [Candidatus Onthovivens sp.]